MRRVVVESPYAGDVSKNVAYAKRCVLDCLNRGEAPLASHLLYPGILDDNEPVAREIGMSAGHAWIAFADAVVVYEDYGISHGMMLALAIAYKAGVIVERRKLYGG